MTAGFVLLDVTVSLVLLSAAAVGTYAYVNQLSRMHAVAREKLALVELIDGRVKPIDGELSLDGMDFHSRLSASNGAMVARLRSKESGQAYAILVKP